MKQRLDPLPILPFENAKCEITLPGSKSITNRALLLASICKKPVTLYGALFSDDTKIMAKALNAVGFDVTLDEDAGTMRVAGQAKSFASSSRVELFVGNAGTAARFLTALCAAAPRGMYELDGVPQMHRRPIRGLIDALRALGADIRYLRNEGFLPIEIHAGGLHGGKVDIDASESSQMLSALLMVTPLAKEPCEIHRSTSVREPFVNMTLSMMSQFGFSAALNSESGAIWTTPADFPTRSLARQGGDYPIEADASSASYFLALPLVTKGKLTLSNMPFPSPDPKENLQGDGPKFIQVVRNLGAKVERLERRQKNSFFLRFLNWRNFASSQGKKKPPTVSDRTGLTVEFNQRSRSKGLTQEFREFSDTFLTIAAITPLLTSSATKITGIGHTRVQETDRIAAMAAELGKIIGHEHVRAKDDALEVDRVELRELKRRIRKNREPIMIETYGDHRVAMSFAILGCFDLRENGKPWLTIRDPDCCAKTFPNFFEVLEKIRSNSQHGL